MTAATMKTASFNFHQTTARIRSLDFLSSALIQNFAKMTVRDLSYRDFDYLLEERIQKFTYFLASYRDIRQSNTELSQIILSEAKSAKHDILYCLHFKYDSETLNQILLMLNQEEKTQELIALELLELVLEEQDKKWILPIFREVNLENILNKLEGEFPQIQMGKEKRLVAILGNNTLDIPLLVKSQALIELFNEFQEPIYQRLTNTLAKNGHDLVQLTAEKLIELKRTTPDEKLTSFGEVKIESKSLRIEESHTEEECTLAYAYWIRDLNRNPEDSHAIPLLYKTLYQVVFPMESLN
jgi:hypothetical protein